MARSLTTTTVVDKLNVIIVYKSRCGAAPSKVVCWGKPDVEHLRQLHEIFSGSRANLGAS